MFHVAGGAVALTMYSKGTSADFEMALGNMPAGSHRYNRNADPERCTTWACVPPPPLMEHADGVIFAHVSEAGTPAGAPSTSVPPPVLRHASKLWSELALPWRRRRAWVRAERAELGAEGT